MKNGQALVTLLVFSAIAIIITSAVTIVTVINLQRTSKYSQAENALFIAEAGADNALLRILRDPNSNYTGETLNIGPGTATITVSGISPKIIISEGKDGNFIRKVQIEGNYINNVFNQTSWKEID